MRKLLCLTAIMLLAMSVASAQKPVKYNQYGVAVSSDRLDVEAQDGILVLASPTSGYKLWFDVRAQADAAVFFGAPEYADPIGNGASIRRARFAVKGQINEDWYGEFDMDLANGLAELKDAIVRYTGIPNLDLQVGNFKENFSLQRNTTSRYLQFMERPMVCSALAPSRHIGINAKYAKDWLWVSAGAFAQEIAGEEEWTNVADNNKDFGRSSGYSLTTKVVFRPLYKLENASLHIGAAYSYRTPKSSMATGEWGTYRASARNSTSINRKKYVDTNNIKDYNHNNLWTVELAGHWDGFRYEAAYIGDNVHLNDDASPSSVETKSFNLGGWYVQAGYLLFGQARQEVGRRGTLRPLRVRGPERSRDERVRRQRRGVHRGPQLVGEQQREDAAQLPVQQQRPLRQRQEQAQCGPGRLRQSDQGLRQGRGRRRQGRRGLPHARRPLRDRLLNRHQS